MADWNNNSVQKYGERTRALNKNITLEVNDDGYAELTFNHALPTSKHEDHELMKDLIAVNNELQTRFGIIKYLIHINLDNEQTEKYIQRVHRQAKVMIYDKVAFYGLSADNLKRFCEGTAGIIDERKLAAFTNREEALAWLQKNIPLVS